MCRGAAIRFTRKPTGAFPQQLLWVDAPSPTPIEQAPAAWYPTNSGSLPPTELLIELVRAGLASAHAERMVADGKNAEGEELACHNVRSWGKPDTPG